MAQYGEPIFGGINPVRVTVYETLVEYYNDPVMTKMEVIKDQSLYMTKIRGLMGVEQRYLIAVIGHDPSPINTQKRLSELEWDAFQARTLERQTALPAHIYQPRRGTQLDDVITCVNKTLDQCTYQSAKSGLTVTLLRSKRMAGNFQDRGTVASALETYQTILTFAN